MQHPNIGYVDISAGNGIRRLAFNFAASIFYINNRL
ncbi:hypothetical protein BOSE62_150373 [Bosea sp. 62]|nr:hypothetical protein BOSE46_10469 [Bosea sp. 46]CAD5250415.1 hypothetical protein BOSE21B_10684 [Bosea sp. 21B]CAD5264384.1 hypothetical protein BOSE7B_150451 [Bosea sp. 7B]VVT44186.1 hypothetical protein BOS5A_10387 [Bosea sp. EC-HK365B]VXB11974.1 hypothetical protein BOSE29B_10465 [Bosea sp. 29B]VXB80066.1 hypothetical protein BOSE62_150373 [Bosea sp. 62]VXC33890.1 hypothetical protein BOSE125_20148 [Bosea sp. 125]VXC42860.1 hypothetical protein BOSE127_190078 [Bosea sp. 127]